MTPTALDLYPAFAATTIRGPQDWSMGYDVIRDAKYDPECGFMLSVEADILRQCSERARGQWLDIGSRMGWTTAHIVAGGNRVIAIDPAYKDGDFLTRAIGNMRQSGTYEGVRWFQGSSSDFFEYCIRERAEGFFEGACIDGDHDAPHPLNDAKNSLAHLAETGVIVLHDFWAHPVRQAVEYLMKAGMKCRFYDTPAGLAVCWRGDFTPPDFTPDPAIDWAKLRRERAADFNFGACQ